MVLLTFSLGGVNEVRCGGLGTVIAEKQRSVNTEILEVSIWKTKSGFGITSSIVNI